VRTPLVLGLAAGLALATVARADDAGPAKEVIKKAVTAQGGAEKIEKYKAARMKSKGTIALFGMDVGMTNEVVYKFPGKIRTDVDVSIMGQTQHFTQVINGDKAVIVTDGGKQDLDGDQLEEAKEAAYALTVMHLTHLLTDKSFTLKSLPDKTADGQALAGVQVSSKGHKDITLYFDKGTGLLARVERKSLDLNTMAEAPREEVLSNYKEFDGIKRHTKLVVNMSGKKFLEQEVSEYKNLEDVDDNTFKIGG
jgi:hypothetical protein